MAAKFLILLGLLGLVAGSRVQEQARAATWLKAHRGDPDDGELAELAKADPNSYAIVKALLAKQKMGLLNMNRAQKSDDEAAASSSESSASAVESSYSSSSVSSGGGGNWLNWKPKDDSAIVGNVLGQVASLRGAVPQAPAPQQQDDAPVQQGLISQQQQTSKSTSEMVTDADSNMDLSFGAYKQAATEQTKSTFDQDAVSAQKGLGQMEADASNMDLPASFNGKGSGSYYGINMNWGQEDASGEAAAAKPHKAADTETNSNSYLSQYPLAMSQTGEQPQARRNPAQILGAWLQKNQRADAPEPDHWWHHIDRHPAPVMEEPATNNYLNMLN